MRWRARWRAPPQGRPSAPLASPETGPGRRRPGRLVLTCQDGVSDPGQSDRRGASARPSRWPRRSADRWTARRRSALLLIPPLGLFASSAGPLGPGGALVRVGRRLPRDLPPQFPSASPDRIEHGATSREEDSQCCPQLLNLLFGCREGKSLRRRAPSHATTTSYQQAPPVPPARTKPPTPFSNTLKIPTSGLPSARSATGVSATLPELVWPGSMAGCSTPAQHRVPLARRPGRRR